MTGAPSGVRRAFLVKIFTFVLRHSAAKAAPLFLTEAARLKACPDTNLTWPDTNLSTSAAFALGKQPACETCPVYIKPMRGVDEGDRRSRKDCGSLRRTRTDELIEKSFGPIIPDCRLGRPDELAVKGG